MKAVVHKLVLGGGVWCWRTPCPCMDPFIDANCGFGWCATQPEALAAALAHIRTHHQPEETK